jgi:hypothetical protein
MEFKFSEPKSIESEGSVEFVGISDIGKVKITMSVLQLAKIWGTDKKITRDMGFGSWELEEQCVETFSLIKTFPNVSVENNSLTFDSYSVHTQSNDLLIWVEDLCGWGNEGIRISMSKQIYNLLQEKKLEGVEINSDSIRFFDK